MSVIGRVAAIAVSALVLSSNVLLAQGFPNRLVTIVVPYPAGGATDMAVRPLVDRMAAVLGQPVMVENIAGGGSTIGTARVARAAPDGYTILVHQVALAAMPALYKTLGFDPETSLTGIGLINTNPSLIVGPASLDAKDFDALAAWMKRNPGRTRVAHAGAGSLSHLCAVAFAKSLGAEINIIPYRGGSPAVTDLLGGHVDLFCPGAGVVLEQVRSGRMRAYAVTSRRRYTALPEVATVAELGHPELEITFWQGLFAPAGTPAPVIARLNAALREALADPAVVRTFEANGMDLFPPDAQTPDAATRLWLSETRRWSEIIRTNNISISP
ncbi:MAG: tripartite tricarboxylate transporter substrate binding protein [Rhodoplanes sp.]|uniref:Bug family tripartite tricarboxylate transporter substrate binding protein n=1 Tax=Rhodoplanes sp. TaxID=1968906 RepID=UPI0017EC5B92|nr:tripartite tricarboxylate transporter substrate binding protein [Rhodoplanes sp.]NVO17446.1 tripartite tricarboxylate transporter substrate binding protein [Rhodoplanes sp.]